MHNECFRGIRVLGLFYLPKLIFLEWFLVFSCLPWVSDGQAGFCFLCQHRLRLGQWHWAVFTVQLCLHEQLKLLSEVNDHLLICLMKTKVLNQWAVKVGVREFLSWWCSFIGAYSDDGVPTEKKAAGWHQLIGMWHKPFSCVPGHSPGTLCHINCCPQTTVGVMGQYSWNLSVAALESASSLCLFPFVLCFRVCCQAWGTGEGVEHSHHIVQLHPTALPVLRNLLLLAWALLGKDSSAAGRGRSFEFTPETPLGCSKPWFYPSFKPVNRYLLCCQIQNLEEVLQFVQQLLALRTFWVVCKELEFLSPDAIVWALWGFAEFSCGGLAGLEPCSALTHYSWDIEAVLCSFSRGLSWFGEQTTPESSVEGEQASPEVPCHHTLRICQKFLIFVLFRSSVSH